MEQTQQRRRQLDHERFKAFERERIRTDEVTNASERLALPMRNRFEYELGADGHLWFQGEALGEIFDRGVRVAREMTRTHPAFLTELRRRVIERDEYDAQRLLALSSDDDPDVLVVLSPIPEAVLEGAELDAYDKERKKTLARIYERSEHGIVATSLSLDQSDRTALQAVATRLGGSIADEASSEDILQQRFWAYRHELSEEPVDAIRQAYDDTLAQLYGGRWYAGQRDSQVFEAMEFIERQPDLISEHLAELEWVRSRHTGDELAAKLEDARYNFAAALSRRLRGDSDAATLADAGDRARENGETYRNDCPEGVGASQSVSELGMGNGEMKCVTCPFCGRTVDAIVGGGMISCPKCRTSVETRSGKVTRPGERPVAARIAQSALTSAQAQRRAHQRQLHKLYGPQAELRTLTVVGGVQRVVVDRQTGDVLAQL